MILKNFVFQKMVRNIVHHALNMETNVNNVSLVLDVLIANQVIGVWEVFALRVYGDHMDLFQILRFGPL